MHSWYQGVLKDRLTHCGHSLDAVFRLTADRSNPLVALKRSDAKSWTDWRPHDHEELAVACAFHGCRHAGSDRTGGRTMRPLLLPARYTTLADLFLTPSVEQLRRYAAVS